MELDKSYRGSSSAQASAYKRKGHDDEDIFAYLIDGTVISGTGKCDVKDSNAKTYSVKGGAKKWQIFLYGENRFKDDNGFHFANLGNYFLDALNSFPKDYDAYKRDKEKAKIKLSEYYEKNGNKPKNLSQYLLAVGDNNLYLNSKISLMRCTEKIKNVLSDELNLQRFLLKSIFNNEEVDYWSIKDGDFFLVFEKEDAVKVLSSAFKAEVSQQITGRKDDISLSGQKVLLKYTTNVVEIEVRNDSKTHYRQIRFNMIREKTLDILKDKFIHTNTFKTKIKFYSLSKNSSKL